MISIKSTNITYLFYKEFLDLGFLVSMLKVRHRTELEAQVSPFIAFYKVNKHGYPKLLPKFVSLHLRVCCCNGV